MTTTSHEIIDEALPRQKSEEDLAKEQIKRAARSRRLRAAQALASRVQVLPDGTRVFMRFNRAQQIQHQVLLVSFTILGLTGLLQRYSDGYLIGLTINTVFGDVDGMRTIHHLAAIALALVSFYHMAEIAHVWFIRREYGSMWPRVKDLRDFTGMLKFNLNRALKRPDFDRFNFEEKVEYWALIWGTLVMGITGIVMWFPALVTSILPGVAVPISRVVHSLEAVLAVLSILIWHLYHTVIKERNRSIFNGMMSEHEMQENHPLEYQRIMSAYNYLKRLKAGSQQAETRTEEPKGGS